MFANVVVIVLLSAVTSDDSTDISPVLPLGNRESKVLFDSIDALISESSPEKRNYPEILQQIGSLFDMFPESRETITMFETLEMWKSLGLISEEQYSPFEKKLSKYRSAEQRGITFFAGIERQYQKYLSSKDTDSLGRIIKSCQDVLDMRDSSKKMKCFALLCLARMHLEKNDVGKSESYLNNLFNEQKLAEQNFSGVEALVSEANNLTANVLLKTRGTNDAIAYWNEFIETDDRRFDEIAHAYEQMLAILDASSEDDAHERKIQLLEEFIAKYPDDSAEQILQARLTLGYLIMSKGMNMDGDVNLGGIMTMERVKMLAENYKANAEKAEIVFQESLALADKVGKPHFVKAFNEALANVANAKNPECPEKLNEVDWIPPKNNKIFIAFLTIANVIFILIVLYSLRERIMRLVNRCFHKP